MRADGVLSFCRSPMNDTGHIRVPQYLTPRQYPEILVLSTGVLLRSVENIAKETRRDIEE